jgi:hypothetical protein
MVSLLKDGTAKSLGYRAEKGFVYNGTAYCSSHVRKMGGGKRARILPSIHSVT